MTRGSGLQYSQKWKENCVRAKASDVPVHFKNTLETANQIRGMDLKRANAYLKNVIARKECVPFKKFHSGIGKCRQAKQFNTVVGRWPVKSAKAIQDLLRNCASNCDYLGKDPQDYVIKHVQVNMAPVATRRTYRAHGRINPYTRHLCHLQMILVEKESA